MSSLAALIVFIKNPVLGQVKTRIAKTAGDEMALQIYLQLQELTRKQCIIYQGPKFLFYSDYIHTDDAWDSSLFNKKLQSGNDLGLRMKHAFRELFQQHKKVIIIGSDCPYLKTAHLEAASVLLETYDCVIGPAKDGGYYLLGLNSLQARLFQDKNWSSATVLYESLLDLKQLNLSYKMLEVLEDIDTLESWNRFLESDNRI
ncbi:MAG: TIGR04282 family arsenosugar biosynthesis glycosyltransferase [Saprospiraceae bacterium]|nr:TIGR04282 family arsenosugar biosynthesis glycosyltransferase [Saprospiraceae bacterium]